LGNFVQILFSGITMGAIYALIAIGFVTIYNVTGIINFAQGEFAMLGALIAISLSTSGLPIALAILLSVLIVIVVGLLLERLAIHPARHAASELTLVMITMGASIVMRGVALLIWGTDQYTLPPFSRGGPDNILGAMIDRQVYWIIGVALVLVVLLSLFFNRTVVGMAVRASMANKIASRLMGISPEKMSLLAFGLGTGLAAISGVVMAPMTIPSYDMGLMLALKGFIAAILGGLSKVSSAVVGGFLLGIIEVLGAAYISFSLRDGIAFFILIIVLVFKPNGILAKASGKRV